MIAANGVEPKGGVSLFWLVYGQIAAVLGALSLLALLTNFADFGLKGVVRTAFDLWAQTARPLAASLVHALVTVLPEAWRFEPPTILKDYAAVGVMLFFSHIRAFGQVRLGSPRQRNPVTDRPLFDEAALREIAAEEGEETEVRDPEGLTFWLFLAVVVLSGLVLSIALWPLTVVMLLNSPLRNATLLALTPFAYLAFILAANAWLA